MAARICGSYPALLPAELADKITKSGIEVEGVEKKSEGLKGVVIGHVLNVKSIRMRIN